jgi:heptaprenyl diphosphate synthase
LRQAARKIALSGILTALALALSIAERWIPLGLAIPVPGIRLGLANIVTMFALFYLGPVYAAAILVVRCILAALFTGITAFPFSIAGGALAYVVMLLLKRGYGRSFSLFGVSMGGAVAHNIGQVAIASLMLGEVMLFTYMPVLMLIGLATGVLTAAVSVPLFRTLDKTGLVARYAPLNGTKRITDHNKRPRKDRP